MVTKQFDYIRWLYINTRRGTCGEGRVYSKIDMGINKRGQFSLLTEGSLLTGLIGRGPKKLSISSKTFQLRISKLDYSVSLRKNSKSIILANFAKLILL